MSNHIIKASFADISDINNGHSLVFPQADPIIHDILSRKTLIRDRIKTRPEGMETFRWYEQSSLARNATFSDPHNIAPTQANAPARIAKSGMLKCITSRITYGFFDSALTRNGTFSYILEQDMRDAIADCLGVSNTAIYTGNDTSYAACTTNQYMGLMSAITNTATLDTTKLLYQQIKSQVAVLTNKKFGQALSLPTAIYMNPITADIIDQEVDNKANNINLVNVELKPGIVVSGIRTAAGDLPIIRDPEVPLNKNATDNTKYDHKILLLNEDLIVRHYFVDGDISYGDPVVFKLGKTQGLPDDYVIFMADNVIVENPDVAHLIATYTTA